MLLVDRYDILVFEVYYILFEKGKIIIENFINLEIVLEKFLFIVVLFKYNDVDGVLVRVIVIVE